MRIWVFVCCWSLAVATVATEQPTTWQSWSRKDAEAVSRSTVARGRIAGGRRWLNTELPHSYKVVAIWATSEVLQASARLLQLRDRLPQAQVDHLLRAAQRPGEIVVIIDLDPNEGSGVIPLDWEAFLQPRHAPERIVAGRKDSTLRDVKVLAAVAPRNYDYDRF
jgi:hypothetical protein